MPDPATTDPGSPVPATTPPEQAPQPAAPPAPPQEAESDIPVLGPDSTVLTEHGEVPIQAAVEAFVAQQQANAASASPQPVSDEDQKKLQALNRLMGGDTSAAVELSTMFAPDQAAPAQPGAAQDPGTARISELEGMIAGLQQQVQAIQPVASRASADYYNQMISGAIQTNAEKYPYLAKVGDGTDRVLSKLNDIDRMLGMQPVPHGNNPLSLQTLDQQTKARAIQLAFEQVNTEIHRAVEIFGGQLPASTAQAQPVTATDDQGVPGAGPQQPGVTQASWAVNPTTGELYDTRTGKTLMGPGGGAPLNQAALAQGAIPTGTVPVPTGTPLPAGQPENPLANRFSMDTMRDQIRAREQTL